jgi:hypothetical protein
MYDIKQFRPALYLLILLGFTGYGLAAQNAGLWAFCVLLVLANAWFIRINLFKPLPRFIAFLVTLIAFIFVILGNNDRSGNLILVAGELLVFLQVVKVWEQRSNRDYAQLLVLSLLLMVAAAISTASLAFGVVFLLYLLLSLYCCLLFHLKVETDEARKALSLPADRVTPATLRQDQRHLPRSMRRLTGLVAVFAITSAVMVFLLFPRGTGAGMFMQMRPRPAEVLTGFSDHVDFQTVAKIAQNDTLVAQVQLFKNGQPIGYNGQLLLRGATHDYYNGADNSENAPSHWERTSSGYRPIDVSGDAKTPVQLQSSGLPTLTETIDINPIGTHAIFAVAGPISFLNESVNPNRPMTIRYSPSDESLQWVDTPNQHSKYSIAYTGVLGEIPPDAYHQRSNIDPLIAEYARRPDVSGGLADRRLEIASTQPANKATEFDEQIAHDIESHLRSNFQYTLDLTDADRIRGQDPMVAFLYKFKRGHCEYFAGAMTLLCQSLGIEARMVVGFKCDDYNTLGEFYNVRQSHAHAWVEVFTKTGWQTFDPTSGREPIARQAGMWQKTMQVFDFLQYTWQNAVIAYSAENRENFIQNVDNRLADTTINSGLAIGSFQTVFDTLGGWLANKIAGPLIILLSVALIGSIGWYFFERWKLHRRASRIGIQFLPASDQFRLVRQLAFYDDLLRLLERNKIIPPKNLTPLEFSAGLSYLPSEVYDQIHRLTVLFYRIRYGSVELNPAQLRRLSNVVAQLTQTMTPGR